VVAVDEPYEKIIPGRRPALVRGMYCEVELQGMTREGRLIIPRSALHDGHVYLLDADQRLQRRAVEIDFAQSTFICLKSGLNEGDILVVSDPVPAIEGMLVEPVVDNDLRQSLIQEATREGAAE
jgi:multidrug efflux pump subunit AcrA (membrane-fusion protein)